MPTGLERVRSALAGASDLGVPICPILHMMGARMLGHSIGRYATDAKAMAESALHAYRRFGYDGLQLSLGVATEAEALGCQVQQPEDGLPVVVGHVLTERRALAKLAVPDCERAGRLPLFADAIARLRAAVGREAWVVATIRGPLLMASQLRGVEDTLIDLLQAPEWIEELLQFTTQVGIAFGRVLMQAGANAIAIGEATCSPDFVSPALYRRHVKHHHRALIAGLGQAGCVETILHICGRAQPIVADVASTGATIMDIDCQVDPVQGLADAAPAMSLRGNIDPVTVLLYGSPEMVQERVKALMLQVRGRGRFILSSGCDVPPDTPPANIEALVRAGRTYG